MVCETQDSNKTQYRVDLVFGEDWSAPSQDFNQQALLDDLYFDFIDIKTNKRVDRLGRKFTAGEKFQLIINGASGINKWGVSLQSKLGDSVTKEGEWSSLTCTTINLVFEREEECKNVTFCVETMDFKNISFSYGNEKKISPERIEKEIKTTGNLKFKSGLDPKAVFIYS